MDRLLHGPLGIRTGDRYRNVAEARVVETIAFTGWIDEDDRDLAGRASSEALKRWIGLRLAFRSAEDGRRYSDPSK